MVTLSEVVFECGEVEDGLAKYEYNDGEDEVDGVHEELIGEDLSEPDPEGVEEGACGLEDEDGEAEGEPKHERDEVEDEGVDDIHSTMNKN